MPATKISTISNYYHMTNDWIGFFSGLLGAICIIWNFPNTPIYQTPVSQTCCFSRISYLSEVPLSYISSLSRHHAPACHRVFASLVLPRILVFIISHVTSAHFQRSQFPSAEKACLTSLSRSYPMYHLSIAFNIGAI